MTWKKKFLALISAVAAALGITIGVQPTPNPSPTPVPTVEPTAIPTTSPTPSAIPSTSPTSTPPASPAWSTSFPVPFPAQGTECYMRNARYGNGVDSTIRCKGDRPLCEALHHVPVPGADCHFDSDVWTSKLQRADYEGFVFAGARAGLPLPPRPLGPVWEYKAAGEQGRCHDDQTHVNTSCDHFGSAFVDGRDDPKTREFEGEPKWLAYQSDELGPYSGFFMVPQTSGKDFGTLVRACGPTPDVACAPYIAVDWK